MNKVNQMKLKTGLEAFYVIWGENGSGVTTGFKACMKRLYDAQ